MNSCYLSLALAVVCALSAVSEERSIGHNERFALRNDDFDDLVFRQIWPESTCMFPGTHTCAIADNINTWVVHGLWPSVSGQMGPTFCNKSYPFDYSQVKPILPSLLQFWPNLYTDTSMPSFWQHEWEKHGTCAMALPQVTDELDYFNLTLALRDTFDFGPILSRAQIVPDDKQQYELANIESAVQAVLKVKPGVVCYVDTSNNVQYLSQMQICMNKQFRLIECAPEKTQNIVRDVRKVEEIDCKKNVPIIYPVIKH